MSEHEPKSADPRIVELSERAVDNVGTNPVQGVPNLNVVVNQADSGGEDIDA